VTKNLGSWDQVVRIFLALGMFGWYLAGGSRWWALGGLILLATVLMRWCPIYASCGLSTRRQAGGRPAAGKPA
jgi:hypothetical protein